MADSKQVLDAKTLNANLNELIAKYGIKVGAKVKVGDHELTLGSTFDDVVLDFDVTIPLFYPTVAMRIKEVFMAAGLHTFSDTWKHLGPGGEDFLHINGTV
jgi:hypothetical protein